MAIKAVLFDLDDTLIDWSGFKGNWWELEPLHLRNVYQYITSEVHTLSADSERFVEEFARRSRDGWAAARDTLIAPHLGNLLIDTAASFGVPKGRLDIARLLDAYKWQAALGTRPFDEVPRVLDRLRALGFELGIVTNSFIPMSLRDVELVTHGLMSYFPRCRWSAADAGFLKPHPNIFRKALMTLNVRPDEAVFIGDSLPADIAGARNVGMKTVWRKPLNSANGYDLRIQPHAEIRTLDDLLGILALWM